MFNEILVAILLFLPAGIANSIPVIVAKTPFLKRFNYPLDFKKTYKGIRIFGDHKTIRGLIFGIVFGILTTMLIKDYLINNSDLQYHIIMNVKEINVIIYGTLAASGALIGDAVKSFFKRRTAIKPGDSWFPFDQIDYIIGALIFISFYMQFTIVQYLAIFIIYFGLHLLSSYIGFLLKLKEKPI